MNRGFLSPAGSVVLAVLAKQHHNIHVGLLALGLGTAGLSFLASPPVRFALYLLTQAALAITAVQVRRHWRSRPLRFAGIASAFITVALLAWSLGQGGG